MTRKNKRKLSDVHGHNCHGGEVEQSKDLHEVCVSLIKHPKVEACIHHIQYAQVHTSNTLKLIKYSKEQNIISMTF